MHRNFGLTHIYHYLTKIENYSRDSLLLKGDIHREKTAEEQFNMLARGWLAYPVTPVARATTAEVRL